MGRGQFGAVAGPIQRLFGAGTVAASSEWQLLHRYLDRRDEVAFGAIVARHGPMVLNICRRTLGPGSPDVDDAFQATFLTLAKKAETLGEHDPVGHWLHGVAYRVALRARAAAARRRRLERSAARPGSATADEVEDGPSRREQAAAIDEELARLPRKYRAPVVLCYLEGLTHEEAARQLGWPIGTVKGRLSRARAILQGRLARRGLAPAVVAAMVAPAAEAALPAALLRSTIEITMASPGPGMVPAAVAALMAGGWTTMLLTKTKTAAAILFLLGTGAAVLAYQAANPPVDQAKVAKVPTGSKPPQDDRAESRRPPDLWATMTARRPDDNPTSQLIFAALAKPLSMNFANDTPLGDVIKYIQQATIDEKALPTGIPIYVDPEGLKEVDKTAASTVRIVLEGVPLRTSLELALKQLKLHYRVQDGVLIIDSSVGEKIASPIETLMEKAERGDLTRDQYEELVEILKLRQQVWTLDMKPNNGAGMGGGFGGGFR